MKRTARNPLKGTVKLPARKPRLFGLFIIFIVAAGLVLRLPRFVPPGAKIALGVVICTVLAVMVLLYIIKKP